MSKPKPAVDWPELKTTAQNLANQLGRAVFILWPGTRLGDVQDSYILPPGMLQSIIWPDGWSYEPGKTRSELSGDEQ